MIPSIFARSVEKDIWVLGICADYLEDNGKDGSILRIIADNHFLLDESGFSDRMFGYGYGNVYSRGDGFNDYGDGNGNGCNNYGDGNGDGYVYGNGNGDGDGFGYDAMEGIMWSF